MEGLNDEMELMTEETAQGLIDAFEQFNKEAERTRLNLQQFNEIVAREVVIKFVEQFLHHNNKYTYATILTRWYWKRKVKHDIKGLRELNDLLEKEFNVT